MFDGVMKERILGYSSLMNLIIGILLLVSLNYTFYVCGAFYITVNLLTFI